MMPNSIFLDEKANKSTINPKNHQTVEDYLTEVDKIKIHEADGICYDGDIENFKWQIRTLPGCAQYFDTIWGDNRDEIEPFIQSLNIGDILYTIVTMASYNETAKSIRYSHQGAITHLEQSLVAALQDRLLIIPKRKQNKIEIPYSEIKKIHQSSETVAGGFHFNRITIELFDGNIIKFHLSKSVSSKLHFLERDKRLVYWIRKNIGYSAASSADEPKLEYQWMSGTIPSSEEESRYENLSIKDLKGILRKRGLSVGGKYQGLTKKDDEEKYKLELIARLKGKEESFSLEPWLSSDRTFNSLKPIDEKDVPEIINLQNKYKSKHTSGYFESSKPQSSVYPLHLYISLFILLFMIFSAMYEIFDDKEKSYSDNQVWFNRLFILTFFSIFVAVKLKTDDLQLNVKPDSTVALTNAFTIIIVVSSFVWFVALLDDPVNNTHSFVQTLSSVGCCGSTFFLVSIVVIFNSIPSRNNILVAEQERFIFECKSRRLQFDAIKCENHGYLDRAKKMWLSFDEGSYSEDVERLEKFEVEIEYVRVKRRISNLKEKGVNCEKLENKLFQESLLKSFGLVESSDSDTINQEQ